MKLKFEHRGEIGILSLTGEAVEGDASRIHREVASFLDQGGRDVILDCERVESVDSKVLEMFLAIEEEVTDRLGRLVLGHCSELLDRVLFTTRLASRFERHVSVDEAVKSLRGAA
jgi:anti-anti-sigma factor